MILPILILSVAYRIGDKDQTPVHSFLKQCFALSSIETIWWYLRPRICVKYFLLFPQKNLSPEKTETNKVFTFQFLASW